MSPENKISESRHSERAELIERIGPWAFQSFSRNKWHQVSDEQIIEGALASAPQEEKLSLLKLYSLSQIMKVWRAKVLIQDEWKHLNNVWIARHLFKQRDPEKFIRIALKASNKQREHYFA